MSTVAVRDLRREFKVPVREAGLAASLRSLFKRTYRDVVAVNDITFELEPGEIVGFLGPNGAGKTTTLKMLSGLLFPDGGHVDVLGHTPSRRERAFLRRIALVMGNRTALPWDLPALDGYLLNKAIYDIPEASYAARRDEFIEILDLQELVTKPIRNLSLGERMKIELAGALLHHPEVLFLDEPTLGLDLTMQKRLRSFVQHYNQETGATVLLTSHYMADVVALAERVIVIHRGGILFDGPLAELTRRFATTKTITVVADHLPDMAAFGTVLSQEAGRASIEVPQSDSSAVAAKLLADHDISDLTITDPPIEDVIETVFRDGSVGEAG